MDGFQVMEGLKTNAADDYLPVLVITAQPGHKLRALQAGAKDFVSKPFDLVEVKTRIRNMLEVRLLYQQLAGPQPAAGTDGAGTHRRAARERSALPQPDRAGLRLVLGAGRERQLHQGVRPGAGDARAAGRCAGRRAPSRRDEGWNEVERQALQATHRSPPARSWISSFSRVNADGSRAAVPGERRADVRPVLPLHRLSRHRRRSSPRSEKRARSRQPAMSARPRPEPEPSAGRAAGGGIRAPGRRTWSWCRCRSARCCTSPATR